MAQSTVDIGSDDPRTTGQFLVASTKRGLASLLTILKYMLLGWAARLALAGWLLVSVIPGMIVRDIVGLPAGIVVGVVGFLAPAVAYGAYQLTRVE